jgi:two-component system, OmpR family, alkaline phosphatase synthesis response regulator PhoP
MEKSLYKILLVDDERDILEFLGYNLRKEGYLIYEAKNGTEAIKIAKEIIPHLILLDVMMPEIDGVETCRSIRNIPELKNVLIAMLTARGEDYSQIAGFEAGADDYITKPVKIKVLISRIKALLKRTDISTAINDISGVITIGNLAVDKEKYIVSIDKKDISLPRKEFELLWLLISKPNKVFTREEIYKVVWGNHVIVGDRTIDVHIRKLREKIGNDYIVTIKGIGYKFEE